MLSQTRQKLKGSWVLGAPLGVKRRASTIPLIALIVGLCCGIAVSHFLAELGNLDMADGYRWVAPVVVVSAGLVIVAVLGRLSQVSYHYWLDAETSRRQLRETIEALPAGVVSRAAAPLARRSRRSPEITSATRACRTTPPT